mmetsp:Transcript_4020/g.6030  ORF Transcript_4020/g.6030 Transcript_4020/m.6030 type:complete len:273 (-) Transcript_4020:224-1042(-)
MTTFDHQGDFILYSDCVDTQVFSFKDLNITKLSKKIAVTNEIERLPPAAWIQIASDPFSGSHYCLMLTPDFHLIHLNLTTLKLVEVADLGEIISSSMASQNKKLRRYDQVVNRVYFDEAHQNKLVLSLANADLSFLFNLDLQSEQPTAKLAWKLLRPEGSSSLPLVFAICPESERLVVGYDDNRLVVLNLLDFGLHEWSKVNHDRIPKNFLRRYNRFTGALSLSKDKFLIYTNYTYFILDTGSDLPEDPNWEVTIETDANYGKTDGASNWFD